MVEARPEIVITKAPEATLERKSTQRSQASMPDRELVEKTFSELQNNEENDIMNYLDYRKLERIYSDYVLMGGPKCELQIREFIAVMLHHLPPPSDKVALVRNLMELFREIDVNGDEDLEWVEFTNHIIDLGMVNRDSSIVDNVKNYLLSDIRDTNHDTEIEHCFNMEQRHQLIVMERDAKRFKVYNTKTGSYEMSVPTGKIS